jgi:hypothetical protein
MWRCGDGLFFEVPPLAGDALLTTLHPLLENVLQTLDHFEISCLGAPFLWLVKPRNCMGRDLDCMAGVLMGFHRSTFSKPKTDFNSDLAPCDFWALPTIKKGAPKQEIPELLTVYSTFPRSGWSVVRSASLTKGGTSKKRPSPHLHKLPTRSNKVSPRTLKLASMYRKCTCRRKTVEKNDTGAIFFSKRRFTERVSRIGSFATLVLDPSN